MLELYDDFSLQDIIADKVYDWTFENATHTRVQLPASIENEQKMFAKGFYFADRTIKTSISLKKEIVGLEKLVRLPIIESNAYNDKLLEIAVKSFTYDRRFHITALSNEQMARTILTSWFENLSSSLVCIYKDNPIGFLHLKHISDDIVFIHLAAVDAQYRATGAGMGLYAKAFLMAKAQGYKFIEGRISSQNVAVMNIYASLGAKFSDPQDIFLKEINNAN